MWNFRTSTYKANAPRPLRLAIRKSQLQPVKKPFNLKLWSILIVTVVMLVSIITGSTIIQNRILYLEQDRAQLKGEVIRLQLKGDENARIVEWFNRAIQKTDITAYVPYLGGINGGGKVYANGEPVLPLAASRQALKNGSVVMGDYVLLIGQIKDKKGEEILGHSFDVQTPDMDTARIIAKRPFSYVNLSSKGSPFRSKP